MSVNFKTTKGLEIVHKLVKEADILVENYIPGMTRMMIDMNSDKGRREVE